MHSFKNMPVLWVIWGKYESAENIRSERFVSEIRFSLFEKNQNWQKFSFHFFLKNWHSAEKNNAFILSFDDTR